MKIEKKDKVIMMLKKRFPKLAGLVVVSLSTCFAGSCATGARDAALTGVFDFFSGILTETLGSVFLETQTLDEAGA